MRIRLSHHYWNKDDESKQYSISVEVDNPIGHNPTFLIVHNSISKQEFENILERALDPDWGGMKETIIDDGKNKKHVLEPKYIYLGD